ncbi:MAG: hypothetical protein ACLP9L_25475 [Thermoguttaceae bacterium]
MQFKFANGEPIGSQLTDAVAGAVPAALGPGAGWGVSTIAALGAPLQYLTVGANHLAWGSAAPTTGTWAQGDLCWNTGATASGSPGWICTAAGTPGTWTAMANT